MSGNAGPISWYFGLNLKYLGWPYREYIKTAKNGSFCEELLLEIDFEAVFSQLWLWCQCFSEAVQKIKDTGAACQLTKTANFIATHMKKHI